MTVSSIRAHGVLNPPAGGLRDVSRKNLTEGGSLTRPGFSVYDEELLKIAIVFYNSGRTHEKGLFPKDFLCIAHHCSEAFRGGSERTPRLRRILESYYRDQRTGYS
jgi:hypothetical protein